MIVRNASVLVAIAAIVFSSQPASAALLTFFNKSAYDAQLSASTLVSFTTNFDSVSAGSKGSSFSAGGIGFSTSGLFQVGNLGATTSGSNSVGYDDIILPEFQAGDAITFNLPVGARGFGLNLITQTNQDVLNFATLSSGAASVDSQGAGTAVPGPGGFMSYFVGIINDSGPLTVASLSYTGGGSFRFDDANVAAVPEPSSLALAAMAGIVGLARRRRR